MVFINKVNNYMFRPKAAIFRLSQLQFCTKSVIYVSILHSDFEISSSYYVLHVSLSSVMSSGSMNGGVWVSLVGYVFLIEINSPLVFQHTTGKTHLRTSWRTSK